MKRQPKPIFTEAYRRAASDELGLHELCARADCQRAKACRGEGSAFEDYSCFLALRELKRLRIEQREEPTLEEHARDYMEEMTRLLDAMRDQSRDKELSRAGPEKQERNEPVEEKERAQPPAEIAREAGPSIRSM